MPKNYSENGITGTMSLICSVIIPTRNRSKLLESTLNSLREQTLPQDQFEVLVVDNGSTDNTKEVAHSFLPRFRNARYFYTEEPGLHVGRHKGLYEAQTDILVYGDDDIIATPTWLEGIIESFQDTEAVLVGGNNYPFFQITPPWWLENMWNPDKLMRKCLPYISVLDFGQKSMNINPHYVWGCNFSIRKNILLEAGGFHPDSMPDNLIHLRGDGETHVSRYISEKGYKSLFNPKASIHHMVTENRMTLEYFKRSAFRAGVSNSFSQIRSHGCIDEDQNNVLGRLKNKLRQLKAILIHAGLEAHASNLKLTRAIKYFRLLQKIRASYYEGYAYHQKMTRDNPHILEWVLKPYYY